MTKQKIGILTLPMNNNYGGIIQLAALYNFLESNNFEVIWIDKKHPDSRLKKVIKNIIECNPFHNIYDPKNFKTIKLFRQKVQPFLNEYLKSRTSPIYTSENLKAMTKDLDSFIVGSDQVWRFEYIKNNYPVYFLDFVSSEKKKIAYAASFGKDYWEGDEKSIIHIKSLIKDFNLVTTREQSGISICNDTFNHSDVSHVLDPSFLPNVSFYEGLIQKVTFTHKIGLFNYVLDSSQKSDVIVDQISDLLKLNINKIYLNNTKKKSSHLIENWLAHFCYADFVVTDSFHGLVFSIIFNKQFIVVGNHSRGITRFNSLLKQLDIEDRMIDVEQFNIKDFTNLKKINYSKVNEKLDVLKKRSKMALLTSLSD